MFKKIISLSLAVIILMLILQTLSYAQSTTIFGPKKYERTTGAPNTYIDTFQVTNLTANYRLVLINGDAGKNRLSAVSIVLNDVEIVKENELNQQIGKIEKPITLLQENILNVKLHSGPQGFLNLWIECTSNCQKNINIKIDYPLSGTTVNKPSVMVGGTITNLTGNETGVTVNGILANMYGSQFVANNIPLQEGANTIAVTAKDITNNTATASITVNAVKAGGYIKLSPNIESGIAPLTTNFSASASNFTPISYQMDFEGDGVIDYTGTTFANMNHTYTTEGIFYPTLTVTDNQGNSYSDTIAITVLSKTAMDTLLKGKWEGMKEKLKNQDTEGAIGYFVERSKKRYRQVFEALKNQMPAIIETFIEFNIINISGNAAEYEIVANENGVLYSYHGMLIKDENGIWKFKDF